MSGERRHAANAACLPKRAMGGAVKRAAGGMVGINDMDGDEFSTDGSEPMARSRLDRKGAAKAKAPTTTVNIIVAPPAGGDKPPMPMGPPMGAMPPPGPMAGPPPGMPMRKDGGRVKRADGGNQLAKGMADSASGSRKASMATALDNIDRVKDGGSAAVKGFRPERAVGGKIPKDVSADSGVGRQIKNEKTK